MRGCVYACLTQADTYACFHEIFCVDVSMCHVLSVGQVIRARAWGPSVRVDTALTDLRAPHGIIVSTTTGTVWVADLSHHQLYLMR